MASGCTNFSLCETQSVGYTRHHYPVQRPASPECSPKISGPMEPSMTEPRSAKEKPIPMLRESSPPSRPAPAAQAKECRLSVRFYRRMRLNRVYQLKDRKNV